jgi:hypothetical protein
METKMKTATEQAIDQVEANASVEWNAEADAAVRHLCSNRQSITSDDVWALMSSKTHEPRAMGAVMRRAYRDGLIIPIDRWVQTQRASAHKRPVRIWEVV